MKSPSRLTVVVVPPRTGAPATVARRPWCRGRDRGAGTGAESRTTRKSSPARARDGADAPQLQLDRAGVTYFKNTGVGLVAQRLVAK